MSFVIDNKDRDLFFHDKCDAFDKSVAVFAGAVGGIVDSLFVGNGIDSKLGKWSDATTAKFVISFAKRFTNWDGNGGVRVALCKFEESDFYKQHKVYYEQRQSSDVDNQFSMSPTNHRIKSLAHSPDLTGLIFSIIDQYTGVAHFISDGQIYTVQSQTSDLTLYGNSFPAKIFCGFINWFIHLVSDISGSPTSKARGAGVPLPFFNLLLLCDFGSIKTGSNDRKTISDFATKIFEKGYDFRVGIAQSIPVVVTNIIIKSVWSIKKFFYEKKPLVECIPNALHDDLRAMELIGNSTFCLIDLVDAGIRSKNSVLTFFMHINYVGWCRLYKLVIRELFIKLQIGIDYIELQYEKADNELKQYISELESYDLESVNCEISMLNKINSDLLSVGSEKECAEYLYSMVNNEHLQLPFHNHDEFVNFMESKKTLVI